MPFSNNALAGILLAATTVILVNVGHLAAGARISIMLGAGLTVASVLINVLTVMHIRWLTAHSSTPSGDPGARVDELIVRVH